MLFQLTYNLKLGWEESSFNIQRDEVSEMLQGFFKKICILEAVASLDLLSIWRGEL